MSLIRHKQLSYALVNTGWFHINNIYMFFSPVNLNDLTGNTARYYQWFLHKC